MSKRVNLKTAASDLGRRPRTLYDWVKRGKLKAYQPGGPRSPLEFEVADVEAARAREAR